MLKKIFLFIVFIFAVSYFSFAQFQYGLRIGVANTNHNVESFQIENLLFETTGNTIQGLTVGGMLQYSLFNFFIQPEILFLTSGIEMSLQRLNMDGEEISEPNIEEEVERGYFSKSFRRFDVPVFLGYNAGVFRFGVGPMASFVISNSLTINEFDGYTDLNYTEQYNKTLLGYQALVGLSLSRLTIDFRWENIFTDMNTGIEYNNATHSLNTRPRQFIVSLGVFF